jgi:hypothetical protein
MAQLYVGKESVSEGIGKRIRRYRHLILQVRGVSSRSHDHTPFRKRLVASLSA